MKMEEGILVGRALEMTPRFVDGTTWKNSGTSFLR